MYTADPNHSYMKLYYERYEMTKFGRNFILLRFARNIVGEYFQVLETFYIKKVDLYLSFNHIIFKIACLFNFIDFFYHYTFTKFS